jgi:hypothetical protein
MVVCLLIFVVIIIDLFGDGSVVVVGVVMNISKGGSSI